MSVEGPRDPGIDWSSESGRVKNFSKRQHFTGKLLIPLVLWSDSTGILMIKTIHYI